MPITTLAEAKAHLRVTTSSEDSLISFYIEMAEAVAAHYCNKLFAGSLPGAVKAGVLLMVDSIFNDRENPDAMSVLPGSTVANLLNTAKEWAFMPSGPAPAGALTDSEIMFIGDEWSRQWAYKNEDGTAINVTGYTGTFELLSGDTVVHSGALTLSNAVGGLFFYSLPDLSSVITAGDYWYRVRVTPSGGKPTTIDRKMVVAQ